MIEIKKGDVISTTEGKSGEGKNGKYAMIPVKAEKGYDKITVWCANADNFDISDKPSVRVADIISVKRSKRQYNDKWYENVDVNCVLEAVEEVSFGNEDTKGTVMNDDEDLPFV